MIEKETQCDKQTTQFVQIVVAGPLRKVFDYKTSLPVAVLKPGCRVMVPFGSRERIGLIIATSNATAMNNAKVKEISRIIDPSPILSNEQMELARWASRYYHYSLGDICFSMMPKKLRTHKPFELPTCTFWKIAANSTASSSKIGKKQQQCLELLSKAKKGLSQAELKQAGIATNVLKRLAELGQIESYAEIDYMQTPEQESSLIPKLTGEQQSAINSVEFNQFNTYLLNGITGSGKTEVYLRLVEQCIENNQQALILVPEIGLTPQTIRRFKLRLNCPILSIHSGLNDTEQERMWSLGSLDKPLVIIATRSGLFASLPNLGIIIIDEEHDTSYKQPSGWRYSARDLAIVRAQQKNIPIMLGSATPSLESRLKVEGSYYTELKLTQRPFEITEPKIELLDIRKLPLHQGLSIPLIDRIDTTLKRGEQVLIFLNRRGYAPVLMCNDCGWLGQCARCENEFTMHKELNLLRCHHCGAQRPIPSHCPDCGSANLAAVGQGTERIEETLGQYFPNVNMVRIDRDSTRKKDAMKQYTKDIKDNKYQLLVGTQMLAKGHHFPNLSLVAIVDMDGALYCADFRATERFGQLLKQVGGRAGRGTKQGHIVIQTRQPDHPLIHSLLHNSYEHFSQQLLQERSATNWPPYSYLAVVNAEATNENKPIEFLFKLREHLLNAADEVEMLGPVPALRAKRSGKYRFQLLLQSQQRQALHLTLDKAIAAIESEKLAKTVRWSLDVDPQDLV